MTMKLLLKYFFYKIVNHPKRIKNVSHRVKVENPIKDFTELY